MAKYFTQQELTHSATAVAKGIDNTPPPDVVVRLTTLANKLLDPIREMWGAPLKVNSGFRSPLLNKTLNGATNSQHLRGEAADISAGSPAKNRQLFDMITKSGIEFDQMIDESNYSWIHLSYKASGNRRQILHL
jgi:hypothetical protein